MFGAKFCFSHFTLIRVKCEELFCKSNIKLFKLFKVHQNFDDIYLIYLIYI